MSEQGTWSIWQRQMMPVVEATMTSPFDGTAFVLIWIGFLVIMSSGIVVFILWAVRAGQFCDQERARHLALMSGIPPAEEDREARQDPSRQQASGRAPDAGRRKR